MLRFDKKHDQAIAILGNHLPKKETRISSLAYRRLKAELSKLYGGATVAKAILELAEKKQLDNERFMLVAGLMANWDTMGPNHRFATFLAEHNLLHLQIGNDSSNVKE